MTMISQTFQIKLSFDEGLRRTWDVLKDEYVALDKAAIVRLALNNLAKQTTISKQMRKPTPNEVAELFRYTDSLEKSSVGMTEKQFSDWWNKNKSSNACGIKRNT